MNRMNGWKRPLISFLFPLTGETQIQKEETTSPNFCWYLEMHTWLALRFLLDQRSLYWLLLGYHFSNFPQQNWAGSLPSAPHTHMHAHDHTLIYTPPHTLSYTYTLTHLHIHITAGLHTQKYSLSHTQTQTHTSALVSTYRLRSLLTLIQPLK